ncbi:MAG: hypothetical protein SAJ12_13460 [Jaaginema sp. PMC 1079.18]|nr:hypothetical protein [Jaaginema sp. PMC 1080.18]MEC4851990.1 hypothetical protein [Jaaginema sp. PMC 1079.18]MEC4867802.1 hypothetical protein [Jaaginema sp. PMC 1078.18]
MANASTTTNSFLDAPDWLLAAGQQSKFLLAALDPNTCVVEHANEAFLQRLGLPPENTRNLHLCDLLDDFSAADQEQLFRRHLLRLILRDIYHLDVGEWRFLEEPSVATLKSPPCPVRCHLEFWLRSDRLQVERIDPNIDEFAGIDLRDWLSHEIVSERKWEEKIAWDNYRVSGYLLWEGIDITAQEQIQRLISWLIEQESVFSPQSFIYLGEQLRSLFHADRHLLLRVKQDQVDVSMGSATNTHQSQTYTLDSLAESQFIRAAQANRIWNVPSLACVGTSELEKQLIENGTQSLLLIPLLVEDEHRENALESSLIGIVAVGSDRPNEFDQLDANHANALIPALKAALRQATHTQFSNIHPAVEWRFRQESERRSLGLPSEQIVFSDVYPMYGLSDIRGSAALRNQAIQGDLLAQFQLALAIVDAVVQYRPVAFLGQLRLDLNAYQERLRRGVNAEDEVSAVDYLRHHVELYFDFFRQCGEAALEAVTAYETACDNEHGYVYDERDRYDATIATVNAALRQNWEVWQSKMQDILPHYCDTEVADGIDHIIYVGQSINSQFSLFHLHSLRYEQLRAMCEAARVCLKLREDKDIPVNVCHLVLVQDNTVDIFHDEQTERLFDVQGTRDTRYEIVKKRIDKGLDVKEKTRITQPGMLTVVYSTNDEWQEYHQYLRYLVREHYVDSKIDSGTIEALQGITGLRFARVRILPAS